jgi:hypothetical protein
MPEDSSPAEEVDAAPHKKLARTRQGRPNKPRPALQDICNRVDHQNGFSESEAICLYHLVQLAGPRKWGTINREELRAAAKQAAEPNWLSGPMVNAAVGQLGILYWPQKQEQLRYVTKIGREYLVNHKSFITDPPTASVAVGLDRWPASSKAVFGHRCIKLLNLPKAQAEEILSKLLEFGYIDHLTNNAVAPSLRLHAEMRYLERLAGSVPDAPDGVSFDEVVPDCIPVVQGRSDGWPSPATGVLTIDESKFLIRLIDYHVRTRWAVSATVEQMTAMTGAASYEVIQRMARDLVRRGYLKSEDDLLYKVIRDAFAQWSRSTIFLLELYRTPHGPHGTVPVEQLRRSLKERFQFDEQDFISDLEWSSLTPEPNIMRPVPSYVLRYYNDDAISLNDRFEKEIEFLILGAREYAKSHPDRAAAVAALLGDVERIRES